MAARSRSRSSGSRYKRLTVGQSADESELWLNWIVRTTVDATPVGVMQATVAADGSAADVAWEVGVPWQGRGIASEGARAVVSWLVEHDVPLHPRPRPSRPRASRRVATHAGLEPTNEVEDGEVVWRRAVV